MTDIERLKATKDFLKERYNEDLKNCKHPELKPLIKETYHENIKAFNIAISALEKQIPKKVNISLKGTTGWNTKCHCPNCHSMVSHGKYCFNCGQALDWSDNNGNG